MTGPNKVALTQPIVLDAPNTAGQTPATAWRCHGVVLLLYVAAIVLTAPNYLGDTLAYVSDIQGHLRGSFTGYDPLWDFGHLIWRPMALLLLQIAKLPWLPDWGLPDNLLLVNLFIGVNLIAGAGLAVVFSALSLRVSGSVIVSILVSTGLMISAGILNYAQTGNAYIAGLFFLASAVLLLKPSDGRITFLRAAGCGLSAAIAILFWFPYGFVAPAVLLIPLLPATRGSNTSLRQGLRATVVVAVCCLALLTISYGAVLLKLNIRSAAEAKTWVMQASHGLRPNQNAVRMIFGIPRAFIAMGDQGKLLKRYLFRDPYNPASVGEILLSAAAPLTIFYMTMAAMLWSVWRSRRDRQVLLVFACAALPVLVFAIFIFEAGAPERYLPVVPFLVWIAALSVRQAGPHGLVARALGTALLALIAFRSVSALSFAASVEAEREQAERIRPVMGMLENGFLAIVSNQDKLMLFSTGYPFHPFNRPRPVRLYDVIEAGNVRVDTWRQDFARWALNSWTRQGNVWVSKRLTASVPKPSWYWVEGDDPRVHWKELPSFFNKLQYERDSGGEDGFLLLQKSDQNFEILKSLQENQR